MGAVALGAMGCLALWFPATVGLSRGGTALVPVSAGGHGARGEPGGQGTGARR